jgi:myo-inositol 2-dehydrogenase/D-chiro-inositol 1-dehydrogenase
MGSPGSTESGQFAAYNNLAVQMAGQHGCVVRWSVHPAQVLSGLRLTVSGSTGRATLMIADETAPWRLETRIGSEVTVSELADWNPYAASLEELREATSGREASCWPDAARAVELAETIDRSLAKGRTINLHEQEFSETSTFKGMMTSVGCALLMASLVLVVASVVVANLLKHAGAVQAAAAIGIVPYVIVGLLGIFLAMQLLLKLARPGEGASSAQATREGDALVKPND